MKLTVHEVAKRCGVSIRTLHYYDQLGLLKAGEVTQAGYRLYTEKELARLQQILFLRELDIPLKDVPALLTKAENEREAMLRKHIQLLTLKRDHYAGLIDLCEKLLQGECSIDFTPFDQKEIESMKAEYAKEAKERWGQTEAYQESQKRQAKQTREEQTSMEAEQNEIFAAFASAVGEKPSSSGVQALVKRWQDHITKWHYPCTKEILSSLGQMYAGDERFQQSLDAFGKGTAALMSQAIEAYCEA